MLKLDWLLELCQLNATPGDETETLNFMKDKFVEIGLKPELLGKHAIFSKIPAKEKNVPTILVCAHLDSPGFIVENVKSDKLELVCLGGAFLEIEANGKIRTCDGNFSTKIFVEKDEKDEKKYFCKPVKNAKRGDRVCFSTIPKIDHTGKINAAFLDNRAGCFLILKLAEYFVGSQKKLPLNLVFAANGTEEMCGFGARVLAEKIRPDFVICLDATYASKKQNIALGKGPVITISDASVLLSINEREILEEIFFDFGLYYQTEVYNFSGTDSKAFPNAGLIAPVIPLLLPTLGNHSPIEIGDIDDFNEWFKSVIILVENAYDYKLFSLFS